MADYSGALASGSTGTSWGSSLSSIGGNDLWGGIFSGITSIFAGKKESKQSKDQIKAQKERDQMQIDAQRERDRRSALMEFQGRRYKEDAVQPYAQFYKGPEVQRPALTDPLNEVRYQESALMALNPRPAPKR